MSLLLPCGNKRETSCPAWCRSMLKAPLPTASITSFLPKCEEAGEQWERPCFPDFVPFPFKTEEPNSYDLRLLGEEGRQRRQMAPCWSMPSSSVPVSRVFPIKFGKNPAKTLIAPSFPPKELQWFISSQTVRLHPLKAQTELCVVILMLERLRASCDLPGGVGSPWVCAQNAIPVVFHEVTAWCVLVCVFGSGLSVCLAELHQGQRTFDVHVLFILGTQQTISPSRYGSYKQASG